jgi:hypothetical protein
LRARLARCSFDELVAFRAWAVAALLRHAGGNENTSRCFVAFRMAFPTTRTPCGGGRCSCIFSRRRDSSVSSAGARAPRTCSTRASTSCATAASTGRTTAPARSASTRSIARRPSFRPRRRGAFRRRRSSSSGSTWVRAWTAKRARSS